MGAVTIERKPPDVCEEASRKGRMEASYDASAEASLDASAEASLNASAEASLNTSAEAPLDTSAETSRATSTSVDDVAEVSLGCASAETSPNASAEASLGASATASAEGRFVDVHHDLVVIRNTWRVPLLTAEVLLRQRDQRIRPPRGPALIGLLGTGLRRDRRFERPIEGLVDGLLRMRGRSTAASSAHVRPAPSRALRSARCRSDSAATRRSYRIPIRASLHVRRSGG